MSIHTSLISTTLLALQQSGVFAYGRKSSRSGFYKEVQHLNSDKEYFSILVYMVSDSPTGYAIRVNALKSPEILVIDHDIESFKDFEVAIDRDYSVDILKVATTKPASPAGSKAQETLEKAHVKYVESLKKSSRLLRERPQLLSQFLVIKKELEFLGISIGKKVESADAVQWAITQEKDKTAALYWTVGCGWAVEARHFNKPIGSIWEGFDLEEHLAANDIFLTEYEDD